MANGQLLNFPSVLEPIGDIASISQVQAPGAQGGSWGIDQVGQIWQGSRVYQQVIRVVTSYAYVGPVQIITSLQAIGVVVGAPYVWPIAGYAYTEQDTGSYLQRITPELETEDGKQWLITLDYGPFNIWHELGTSNIQYGSFTPLDFPPIIKWSTNKYHRFYPTDVYGNPFINTAGEPLENPPQREESTQNLRLILWNATPTAYDDSFAQSFRDTINGDTFLNYPPGQVKCKDIDGERIFTSDYGYIWRIIYDFEIRQIVLTNIMTGAQVIYGWQDLVLNVGYRAFGGASGVVGPLAPITIGGNPVPTPAILNPNGTANVPATAAAVQSLLNNPNIWLTFNNYPTVAFAGLNIDQNILTASQ
jgi:hypothetical protein